MLEVLGSDVGSQVETEDRAFDGISIDVKDGEDNAWITFGYTPEFHLTHGISGVTAILVRPLAGLFGAALLIAARDGGRTLLELSLPEDYALPPASQTDGLEFEPAGRDHQDTLSWLGRPGCSPDFLHFPQGLACNRTLLSEQARSMRRLPKLSHLKLTLGQLPERVRSSATTFFGEDIQLAISGAAA